MACVVLLLAGCGESPSPTTAPDAPVAASKHDAPLIELPRIPLGRDFAEELVPVLEPLENPGGAGDAFGGAVAAPGDVDGDGVDDLAVAAPGADRVHVFSGDTRERLYSFGDPDGRSGFFFGLGLAAVGDVDGDGVADLAVGAPGDPAEPTPPDDVGCIPRPSVDCSDQGAPNPIPGRAFLFSGADGAFLRHLRPEPPFFTLGMRLAGPGDLDRDGVPDVAASAPFTAQGVPGAGHVFALSGATGEPIWTVRDPPACGPDPSPICGEDFASFGMGLAAAGDVDGDGVRDLLVGDPSNAFYLDDDPDFRDQRQPSRAAVLSGATGEVLRLHEEPTGATETGWGGAVATTGLPTGGGPPPDYVVAVPNLGALQLFDGSGGARLRRIGSPAGVSGDLFSSTLAPGEDYDGDGWSDVWVGAAGSGSVHLMSFGRPLLSLSGLGTGAPLPLTFTLQMASTGNLGFDARRDLLVGDAAEAAAYVLRVETPSAILREELARIAGLRDRNVLSPGQANSLGSKVRASLDGAEEGNPKKADRPLGALEKEVSAYERADVLTSVQARWLIDPVTLLRAWLEETTEWPGR